MKNFIYIYILIYGSILLAQDFERVPPAFPILEFFNISGNLTNELGEYLCHLKSSNKLFCCSCERNCLWTRTCCIDYLWDVTYSGNVSNYIKHFTTEMSKYKITSCEDAYPLAVQNGYKSEKYYMIATCQESANKEDVDGCHNTEQLSAFEYNVPVFGEDSYIYKNAFCAKCNGIDTFVNLKLSVTCLERILEHINDSSIPLIKRFETCTFLLEGDETNFDNPYATTCTETGRQRSRCNNSNNPYYDLCYSYYAITSEYANYHCYLCELHESSVAHPIFSCPTKPLIQGVFSWSFTLNFAEETEVTIRGLTDSEETYCKNNSRYNVFNGECEVFTCTHGYEKNGTSCQKILSTQPVNTSVSVNNTTFDNCLMSLQPYLYIEAANSNKNASNRIEEIFRDIFKNSSAKVFNELFSNANMTYYISSLPITNNTNLNERLLALTTDNLIEKIYISKNQVMLSDLYQFNLFRSFSNSRLCANITIHKNISTANFSRDCSVEISNVIYSLNDISQWISYTENNIDRQITTCESFYLSSDCALTVIKSNYTISEDLILFIGNEAYYPNQYVPLSEGIGVCTHMIRYLTSQLSFSWKKTTDDVEYYIAIIITPISIMCYILILIVYIHNKEYQKIPGLIVIGLCSTLLVTDIIFLIAGHIENNDDVCKRFAICLHWFLLAVQGWIIVMAFDFISLFGSLKHTTKNAKYRILLYFLFVIMFSTSLVVTLILLDEFDIYESGYGLNNVCFINKKYPRIYFYIIPAIACLVFSFIAFLRSFLHIRHKERKTREVLGTSGRKETNLIKVALKLVIILGLIEIVGFIQIIKENPNENEEIFNTIFSILYSTVRSLRGVFMLIIYIYKKEQIIKTKKMFGMYIFKTTSQSFGTTSTKSTTESFGMTSIKSSSRISSPINMKK